MIENIAHYILATIFAAMGLVCSYGLYIMIRWGMGIYEDLKFILFYVVMATICFIAATVILIDSSN